MVTGWKKIGGHYYYIESNIKNGKETAGYMITYRHEIKGKRYYFGRNGKMVTSKVIDWKGKKYYVEKNGVMAVNKTIVDSNTGKTYKADEKGVLAEATGNAITSLPQAYSVMTDYINGKSVSEERLNNAIDFAAGNGPQNQVKSLSSQNSKGIDYDIYDNQILGWTNYWNYTLKGTQNSTTLDANIVKAIMYVESKMGYYSTAKNGDRDIMQSLFPGDYTNIQTEGTYYGLPANGYGLLNTVIVNDKYMYGNVTPNMSIAFGIRWLKYKIAYNNKHVNDGIDDYNGGGVIDYSKRVSNAIALMK